MNPPQTLANADVIPNEKAHAGAFVAERALLPIIPIHTGRYDVKKRVKRSHTTVPAGRNAPPKYTTKQWARFVHPEGKSYFCRNAQLRVVTDAYMDDESVATKITKWVAHIEKLAEQKSISFQENIELFLQIDEEDDCFYYFADHTTRALFWLEQYETTEIGFDAVVSSTHLNLLLEEAYWQHLERHPMHDLVLNGNIINEMISILVNGAGDHLTSGSSTFPYAQDECKRLVDILVPCRNETNNGFIISLVARLYSVVVGNRYYTHYGEEQARLARDTSILEEQPSEIFWTQAVLSAFTFRGSERFHSRMTSIFTDNYVYEYDWRKLMSDSLKKWRTSQNTSLALLLLHVFCFYLPVSQNLAMISGASLSISLMLSMTLIRSLEDQEEGTAADAHKFLSAWRSPYFGFQGTALTFALPQALQIWGVVFMVAQAFTFAEPADLVRIYLFVIGCVALAKVGQVVKNTLTAARSKVSSSIAV